MMYLFVLCSVLIAAYAQVLLKREASVVHSNLIDDYLNKAVIIGYCIMGISLLINIFAMSHGIKLKEVSIMETLSYLFVPVISHFVLKERTTRRQKLSIALIMIGIVIFFI